MLSEKIKLQNDTYIHRFYQLCPLRKHKHSILAMDIYTHIHIYVHIYIYIYIHTRMSKNTDEK